MQFLRNLLDRLPGVDFFLARPESVVIAVCAGALFGIVLVIVL